jgi:hypothetical protein
MSIERGDRPVCSEWCQHPCTSDTTVLVAIGRTWSDRLVRTAFVLAQAQLRRGWWSLVALAFGVPFGIVVGRWMWTLLASAFGTLAEPVVPIASVTASIVAVLLLAAVSGLVPIRRGLRHRPAEVLRSE